MLSQILIMGRWDSMKIRNGFVSNSSSSSFVIARRFDCTLEDADYILRDDVTAIEQFIGEGMEYLVDGSDTKRNQIETMINVLSNELFGLPKGMRLGDWDVYAMECTSNDGSPLQSFLYSHWGGFSTDKIKMKCVG
jgi:hypothetical protein